MTDIDIPEWLPEWGLTGFGALGVLWAVGPSVRAVGKNLGQWTEYHTANILRLSGKVERRLAVAPADKQDGEVHPRVAKEVIDNAAWIGDDLHQEYLAALLVGARSPDGKDDSAMYDVRLLNSLPANAVRLHYAIYSNYFGTSPSPQDGGGKTFLRAPFDHMTISATQASFEEVCGGPGALDRAATALYREQLIKDIGGPVQGADDYQLIPSSVGAGLFVHSFFGAGVNVDILLVPLDAIKASSAVSYQPPPEVPTLDGVRIGPVRQTRPVSH